MGVSPPAPAGRVSCPRPLAPRLGLRWTLFKGDLSFLHAGAGRSRRSGRDARATAFSPESIPNPKSTLRLPKQIRPRSVCARGLGTLKTAYEAIEVEIITRNMRTAGMSRERYFGLLNLC